MVSKEKELDLNQKQLQKLALAEGKEQAIKEIPEEIESPVITARSRSRTVGQVKVLSAVIIFPNE